ncbi:MAG: hypothetical protein HYR85_17285 [Planctomycetes bacterium]|nr:hypothetical protein [Planctomycetota bacterium]MBI3844714.1 hypothetical protein [Planctomycetota bacterium]
MFSEEMRKEAFKATNGEFGWTRAQVPRIVEILTERDFAILGGELWWVLDGALTWNGLIPQRTGADAVYPWETKQHRDEPWSEFVRRCASDTIAAVSTWPRSGDLPSNLPGRVLYNLTWVSEAEYDELDRRAV